MTLVMDFGQFNLDRLPVKEIKSQDVMKKHSVDPSLENDPLAKANLLFTSGDELQKFSVFNSFSELFAANSTECLKTLVPKMQQTLPNASTEYHVLASQAVRTLLVEKIISPEVFVNSFLQTILTSMDNRDPAVAIAWSDTLFEVMDLLPAKTIQTDVFQAIVARCDSIKPIPIRLIGCKLLRQIVKHCDVALIKKDLLPVVISLSQDVNEDIRAGVCFSLDAIARQAGPEILKTHLMNCIVDLANDDSHLVKDAAFTIFVNILPIMPNDMLKTTGVPLVMKFITFSFRYEENLLITVSEHFGKICSGLERAIQFSDKEVFINWFLSLSALGVPQVKRERKVQIDVAFEVKGIAEKLVLCRQNCADNFIMVVKFCRGDQDRKYLDPLRECYHDLCGDPYFLVRKKICAVFTEVLNFYGKYAGFLKEDFTNFLSDQSEEVLETLVPQLSAIVDGFVKYGIYKQVKDVSVLDWLSALMKCETTLSQSHNWRLYIALLSQVETINKNYQSETVSANFLPLLWKRLSIVRTLPGRIALVRNLVIILRLSKKPHIVNEIKNKLINDLCLSNSFYNRMLFLKCCPVFTEIFSTKFFKDTFFHNVVLLSEDPVPNIRWAYVKFLPNLFGMINQHEDRNMYTQLMQSVQKLETDIDREVRNSLLAFKPMMDKIDKDKMYPDDKKKIEAEALQFVDMALTKASGGNPMNNFTAMSGIGGHGISTPGKQGPVSRPGQGRGGMGSIPPNQSGRASGQYPRGNIPNATRRAGSVSDYMIPLNDKEFLIDAGVSLSVTAEGAKQNNPKPSVVRRGVPVRRNTAKKDNSKRHSFEGSSLQHRPSKNENSNLTKPQRHSVAISGDLDQGCNISLPKVSDPALSQNKNSSVPELRLPHSNPIGKTSDLTKSKLLSALNKNGKLFLDSAVLKHSASSEVHGSKEKLKNIPEGTSSLNNIVEETFQMTSPYIDNFSSPHNSNCTSEEKKESNLPKKKSDILESLSSVNKELVSPSVSRKSLKNINQGIPYVKENSNANKNNLLSDQKPVKKNLPDTAVVTKSTLDNQKASSRVNGVPSPREKVKKSFIATPSKVNKIVDDNASLKIPKRTQGSSLPEKGSRHSLDVSTLLDKANKNGVEGFSSLPDKSQSKESLAHLRKSNSSLTKDTTSDKAKPCKSLQPIQDLALDKANNNTSGSKIVMRRSNNSFLPRPLSCLNIPLKHPQSKLPSAASKLPSSSKLPMNRLSDKTAKR